MDIEIGEMTSTVHAADANAALSPQNFQKVLAMVMKAVHDEHEHEKRVKAEKKVSSGVRDEQEGESQ